MKFTISNGKVSANVNAYYDRNNDRLVGEVYLISVKGKPDYWGSIKVPLAPIRAEVIKKLNNRVGWGWSDIKRSSKRIVKRVGSRKMLKQVDAILSNKGVMAGMAVASTVYPPLGIAYGTVKASVDLLERATAGDENAQLKLIEIVDKAKSGDPAAAKVSHAMLTLYELKKNGADISGWLYNLPYRNNFQAGALDTTNPFHMARAIYNKGIR